MSLIRSFSALTALVLVAATSGGALAQPKQEPDHTRQLGRVRNRRQDPNQPQQPQSVAVLRLGVLGVFLAGKPAQDEPRHVAQLEHAGVAEPLGWWRRL